MPLMIKYPKGSLMEQIFSGEYGIKVSNKIFTDHERKQGVENEDYSLVEKGDRITEVMREDGLQRTLYADYTTRK